MKRPTPSLILIFITVFLDVLGFGLLIPVAPRLIATVQGLKETGFESEASSAVGYLAAIYALMQFIFAPILGSLSDHFGRRPVLLFSLLGSGLDYFMMALAPNLALLFITRALNGLTGASITTCSAYIADITPPEKRAAGFGIIGAAFGLGFVLGPLAGGLLGQYDIHYPFFAAGALTLLNWCYGLFILPESLPREHRRPFSLKNANPLASLAWLGKHKVVTVLAAAIFLINVGQLGLHVTWALSMTARFMWTTSDIGWSMFVVGLSAAVVQGGLARRIIPALGERACLIGGITLGIFAFLGYGLANHGWMIYAIIAVASIGGVAGPAAQAIMSKAVSPREQGRLQGGLTGLQSIAQILGALVATNIFRVFTSAKPPFDLPQPGGAPFLTGAILSAVSLLPILSIWSRMPTSVRQPPVEEPSIPEAGAA